MIHRLLPEAHSESGVRRSLGRLVKQGIALDQVAGQTHTYALNRQHLLAAPVIAMARSRDTLLQWIREEIDTWSFTPLDVRIFGSAARNEMGDDSDIDLFVVLPEQLDAGEPQDFVANLAEKVTAWTGNDARPLVYASNDVRADPLMNNIAADGLRVFPSCRWLEDHLRVARAAS
ncbi:nucleotidyltransferase family protein [Microbacterium sp. A93]|uniref:nucleotidyltransferase family protein n=1 Tax=Microbacterium sp. A93 TaxID=3450716 RepID=UPI003F439CAA